MIKPWKTLKKVLAYETPIFKLWRILRRSQIRDIQGEFYSIEAPDWVNVIALTPDGEAVLVRQYRHGTDDLSLEIPGGVVDEGEHPEETAARELAEETGYTGDSVIYLGTVTPNPAIQDNRSHVYLITNAQRTQSKNMEPDEEIETELQPLSSIPDLIRSGEINHALVVAGFYYYSIWDEDRESMR